MRVVVKIGTSSITNELGRIREGMVTSLCDQVATLHRGGHEVLVVSSGAVASGVAALGMTERPSDTLTLQAVSAVGQSRLMSRYDATISSIVASISMRGTPCSDCSISVAFRSSTKTTPLRATRSVSATTIA